MEKCLTMGTFNMKSNEDILESLKVEYDIPQEIIDNVVIMYEDETGVAFAIATVNNEFKLAISDSLEFSLDTLDTSMNESGLKDISNFLYDDHIYISDEYLDTIIEFLRKLI